MREFGPIYASSSDDNSQIKEDNKNNQANFTVTESNNQQNCVVASANSNETEKQTECIQSSCCQQINEQGEDIQSKNVQKPKLSCCEKAFKSDPIELSYEDETTNANFSRNDTNDMDNRTTSNLIKFNDDDNDCYNNFRSSDRIVTTTGNETNQINEMMIDVELKGWKAYFLSINQN